MIEEIDSIAEVLHLSRTEWLRMKIAQAAKEDSINLREAIALEYARGHISEEKLRVLLGSDANDIVFITRKMMEGKTYVDELVKRK